MPATLLSVSETEVVLPPVPGVTGRLHTQHYLPEGGAGEAWAHVALLHGYGEHGGRHGHFLRWLAERGVAGHSLDFRGQGRSEGRRGFVARWEDYLKDVSAFLRSEPLGAEARAGKPLFVMGHSHGGLVLSAAVIHQLPELDGTTGVLLTAPYFRCAFHVPRSKQVLAQVVSPLIPWLQVPSGLKTEWMSADPAMLSDTRQDPLVSKIATPRWYVEHRRVQAEILSRAEEFRRPLLMVVAGRDPIADPEVARTFFDRCASTDKTLLLRPDALHEVLREADREQVFAGVLDWLRQRA